MNAHHMIKEGVPITLVIPKEGAVLGIGGRVIDNRQYRVVLPAASSGIISTTTC